MNTPWHPPDSHKTHEPPMCFQTRQWKWADSSAFDFESWDHGQPSNMGDKEDCAVLYHLSGFNLWHDFSCSRKFSFVCQYQL
ncbi:C-type lectin lectoxin-Enh2-like [Guaruba guarouba]